MIRPLGLFLLAAALAAADATPIGIWRFGPGTVDGQPAQVGTIVLAGQTVVSADELPLRLEISEAPACAILLAAGSTGRLNAETQPDGSRHLVLDLDRGAAQVDVGDKGPFTAVRVRGAACDVRVTGTLFVVERVRRDADYVALVRGHVQVSLKPDIAKALGRDQPLELTERQGVQADASGFASVDAMSNRPQLNMAVGIRAMVQDQATGTSNQGTSDWGTDLAGQLTGLVAPAPPVTEVAPVLAPAVVSVRAFEFPAVAEQLAEPIGDLGGNAAHVQEQVIQSAPAAVQPPKPLAPPPAHP